jgi:hypothetical protein
MLQTNFWASLRFIPKPSVDILMTLIIVVIQLTACDVTTYPRLLTAPITNHSQVLHLEKRVECLRICSWTSIAEKICDMETIWLRPFCFVFFWKIISDFACTLASNFWKTKMWGSWGRCWPYYVAYVARHRALIIQNWCHYIPSKDFGWL